LINSILEMPAFEEVIKEILISHGFCNETVEAVSQ
jgi:hypothetical protein